MLTQTANSDPAQIYSAIIHEIEQLEERAVYGRISAVQGMLIEVAGIPQSLSVGDRCEVSARNGRDVLCEVIGFRDGKALAMPFHSLEGIGPGCKATILPSQTSCRPDDS